jgi:hypothetical protein
MDEDTLQRSLRSRPPADPVYRPRLTDQRATIAPAGSPRQDRVTAHRPTLLTRFQTMNATLKLAALAVLALAVGVGVVQLRQSTDQIGTAPSPSPSPSPLVWSPASLEQDWPAPVRAEPVGGPVVVPLAREYTDRSGDIESFDVPWVDIGEVTAKVGGSNKNGDVNVDVASSPPAPAGDSNEPWIAYGLVVDTDLDGVADVRLGMDRIRTELAPWARTREDTAVRVWRTDLRTGTTESGEAESTVCDCYFPGGPRDGPVTIYPQGPAIQGRFYVWASVIQDGRVVTDYAPDTGWFDTAPLVWTPASIEQDWPAPVRQEAAGDPVIIPFAAGYLDGRQDTGGYDIPWIDIIGVRDDICNPHGACLDLAGGAPGSLDPRDSWIAYGLVFDTDLDGVADVRLGMDRVPTELAGWKDSPSHIRSRAWRTDLRTGVTDYGEVGDKIADGQIPGGEPEGAFVKLYPHNSLADDYLTDDGSFPGPTNAKGFPEYLAIPGRFYVWASVIEDGRVVATDYAPDTGWLVKP